MYPSMIQYGIGVYGGGCCVKKPKKQNIDCKTYSIRRSIGGKSTEVIIPWTDMLKESLIRSLYRDSDKLLKTEDEQFVNRLRARAKKAENNVRDENKRYNWLYYAVEREIGHDRLREIVDEATV